MPRLVATGKMWDYIIEDEAEEGESGSPIDGNVMGMFVEKEMVENG